MLSQLASQWKLSQHYSIISDKHIYIYIYIYILYFYITVRLQQSAQWEEQIIGIKNDSLVYNY